MIIGNFNRRPTLTHADTIVNNILNFLRIPMHTQRLQCVCRVRDTDFRVCTRITVFSGFRQDYRIFSARVLCLCERLFVVFSVRVCVGLAAGCMAGLWLIMN